MMMVELLTPVDGSSYAAMLAVSGGGTAANPSGTANETLMSGNETFGGGHAGKTQEVPTRDTMVPSGQVSVPTGQTIGWFGCSTAFWYTRPPRPMMTMSRMPNRR